MERGVWFGKLDFLMSSVAYTVGLDSILRFPYLCYKHNGGAFLVPYIICWLAAAMPIFFIEVSMGQFSGESGITLWKLCPLFKGVGIANNIIASLCSVYYCVIICWALFYVISSFTYSTLPWLTCNNEWNTELCSVARYNSSMTMIEQDNFTTVETSVMEFWRRRVLKSSSGIDEFGTMQWELTILLAVVWILTYFAVYKGITNSRKLIYICAIMPYCVLAVLLIRGLTLEGAYLGLSYFFKPDIRKLLSIEVWIVAGTQVVYSSGVGFGTLVALGSYNKYQHNVYKDAITLFIINLATGLVAGCLVFSFLGFMANATGNAMEQIVTSGMDLAFLVFPQVFSMLTTSQVWSAMFFLMMAMLVLGSMICMVEGVVLALCDQFPNVLRRNKMKFVAFMCLAGFLLGLPMVSQSGQHWLVLVDTYGTGGLTLLFVLFFEIFGLSWGFGAASVYNALEDMLGKKISRFWYFCWRYTAPLFCLIIFAIILIGFEPLMSYPYYATVLGLTMSFMPMLTIPAYAIYQIIQTPGRTIFEKIKRSMLPSVELRSVGDDRSIQYHHREPNAQCRYGGESKKWRLTDFDVDRS